MIGPRALIVAMALAAALVGPPCARAHDVPPILRDVGFDQHLGAAVPSGLVFRDERGRAVRLGSYFGSRPVVLSLNQYRCPNLCPLEIEGLAAGLRQTRLTLGTDYTVVTVGIDPRETFQIASLRKAVIVGGYFPRATAGDWHALTGDQKTIDQLAAAVGFRYAYDKATDRFAHPTGVVVLTPGGRIARYLFGIDFPARDLRLALTEASGGRIGSFVDHVLLACYRYDAATGRYTPAVMGAVRVAAAATLLAVGAWLALLFRGERRARHRDARATTAGRIA